MATLETVYMGIHLKNPVIAGAGPLTANMAHIKALEEAGAGAIVTKSLFEEQIQLDRFKLDEEREQYYYRHPEMVTVGAGQEHAGPQEHLYWVKKAKNECRIPVIASLNAVNRETWVEYAGLLESTGVDGLELNFYNTPETFEKSASDIEKEQLITVRAVLKKVTVPVSVKLSPFYTNPLHFIQQLDAAGVRGIVLFNRLFQPEIDIHEKKHVFPFYPSHPEDHRLPLRFAGLLHGSVRADICSSTGIYEGADAVKMILAGASCFQMVSALLSGPEKIKNILSSITDWMTKNRYEKPDDFRGAMNRKNTKDPWAYTRSQYIKWVMQSDAVIGKKKAP